MATGAAVESLERLAQDVFEVIRQLWMAAPRGRRRPGELKDGEFLTLAMLQDRGTLTVGEIQRELGVLPAQMSRIIRALEDRASPAISCHLNPQDKRKIDVALTDSGSLTLEEYSRQRTAGILDALRALSDDEQEALETILYRVREHLRR